jgi:hypothetical protein
MSPVGGSRHYQGGGLGQIGMWACPSCGEDNTGALEQGCMHCGAGKPSAAASPPSTPPPNVRQGDFADLWAEQHPGATLAQAYRAGAEYVLSQVRERHERPNGPPQSQEPAMPAAAAPTIDARTYRTVVAALALFRDQILAERPEEIAAGEWLSAEEATTVIDQLQQMLGSEREVSHAL